MEVKERQVVDIKGSTILTSGIASKYKQAESLLISNGVTQINFSSFRNFKHLKEVELPKTLSVLEEEAFAGCTNLTKVIFTGKLKKISARSFSKCVSLKEIKLPEGVEVLAANAFSECVALSDVKLPDSLKQIEHAAFRKTALTSVNIPSSVRVIGDAAFSECTELTQLSLPNRLKEIDHGAFTACGKLKSVSIPKSVKNIGQYAFGKCVSLEEFVVPKGVKDISEGVFASCFNLTNVTIPTSVKSVGEAAFLDCRALKEVALPKSVSKIGQRAFAKSGLERFELPRRVKIIEASVFSNCENLTEVKLHNGVKKIDSFAFNGCKSLTELALPDSISSIGDRVFKDCTSLKSVALPAKLTTIERSLFENCSALENVVIPDKVHTIERLAFNGCTSLKEVQIPSSVTKIGEKAFEGCDFKYYYMDKQTGKHVFCSQLPEDRTNCDKVIDLKVFDSIQGYDISRIITSKDIDSQIQLAERLNKAKMVFPARFVYDLSQNGQLESFVKTADFRFFRAEVPQFGEMLKSVTSELDKAALVRGIVALGCFSSDKVVDKNGRETEVIIAQKASSCYASMVRTGALSVGQFVQNFGGMDIEATPSQDLLSFLSLKGQGKNLPNVEMLKGLEENYPGVFSRVVANFDDVKKLRIGLDASGRPYNLSWSEVCSKYYRSTRYENVTEFNEDIADVFIDRGIPQEVFDNATELRQTARKKGMPSHILGKPLREETIMEKIERIKSSTAEQIGKGKGLIDKLYDEQFTFEMLDKYDPRNAIMGIYCTCCATINSEAYGRNIATATMVAEDVQNLVVRNSGGEIIAKGTMYVNKSKGYIVINDFEVSAAYRPHEDLPSGSVGDRIFSALMRGVETFVSEYDKQHPNKPIKQVNVGMGYNRLRAQCNKYEIATENLTVPHAYRFDDALSDQRVLYRRDDGQNQPQTKTGDREL